MLHMIQYYQHLACELFFINETRNPDVHVDYQLSEAGKSVVTCAYGKVSLQ